MEITITDLTQFMAFWLCFSRWFGLIMGMPFFELIEGPQVLWFLLSFIFTLSNFPFIQNQLILELNKFGVGSFWLLLIFELLVGLSIGMILKIFTQLFVSTGSLISQTIGLSAIRYFDQNNMSMIGPIEKLIQFTILILVFNSNFLYPIFKSVFNSFYTINFSTFYFNKLNVDKFLYFVNFIFVSSLVLGLPIVASNLVLNITLGVLGKFIPQINIFMIGFIFNIMLGFIILFLMFEEFIEVAKDIYFKGLQIWSSFLV
jgi:flagellar biosynthetic protein FliR